MGRRKIRLGEVRAQVQVGRDEGDPVRFSADGAEGSGRAAIPPTADPAWRSFSTRRVRGASQSQQRCRRSSPSPAVGLLYHHRGHWTEKDGRVLSESEEGGEGNDEKTENWTAEGSEVEEEGEAGDDVKAVKSSEVEGILTGVGSSDESSEDK